VRVVNLALGNHVVDKGAGALKHRAAELLGCHELTARYLNAGLNLEQVGAKECDVGQTTARLKKGQVSRNKAQQHAIHHRIGEGENFVDGGIGVSLDVFGGLDGNKRLAHRDKTRIMEKYVVAALSRNLGGLMRASRDFGVRKMQNGRIGLLGMDTVIHVRQNPQARTPLVLGNNTDLAQRE